MAESIKRIRSSRVFSFRRLRSVGTGFLTAVLLSQGVLFADAQTKRPSAEVPKASHLRDAMSPEARELVERAIEVICLERKSDPKGSIPIDDMQGRPSLPVGSPEALAGAERAQRLLPIAKDLVIKSIRRLAEQYGLARTGTGSRRLQQAIFRVQSVKRIRPDMDSRDNASVLLRAPHTITFGTIFLAGLPSDEAMISVLAHELMHIADGAQDSLQNLFRAVGKRAASLTALPVRGQRAEELTCDLIGVMAARYYVSNEPNYEQLSRRIARSVAHNCVEEDEGDEDHLSPRNTIRALLALDPSITRELVYNRDERAPKRSNP
jgi:hypothetical protein